MKQLITLFLVIFLVSPAFAKAPVWEVTKGDDLLYLGGTIHLLSKGDYPLPPAFETAYNKADDLVFETDINALSSLEAQGKILNAMMYQGDQTLSTVLDPEVYSQLEEMLGAKGMPMAVFERFTPAGVMLALTQLELQSLGLVGADGVDAHFGKRATEDNKESIFLESLDEQIGFIQSMNGLDANLVVKSGINDISKLQGLWEDLLAAWRSGNIDELEELGIKEMERDFPSLYETIIVNRNNDWFTEIESMILTEDKEFILVGALHMAGDDGLVKRLRAAGYSVKQLD